MQSWPVLNYRFDIMNAGLFPELSEAHFEENLKGELFLCVLVISHITYRRWQVISLLYHLS